MFARSCDCVCKVIVYQKCCSLHLSERNHHVNAGVVTQLTCFSSILKDAATISGYMPTTNSAACSLAITIIMITRNRQLSLCPFFNDSSCSISLMHYALAWCSWLTHSEYIKLHPHVLTITYIHVYTCVYCACGAVLAQYWRI